MKQVSVAVIGPSGSGKSTFIASLCNKEARQVLMDKTARNTSGQTKIVIHYNFNANKEETIIKPFINKIAVYNECLAGLKDEESDKEVVQKRNTNFNELVKVAGLSWDKDKEIDDQAISTILECKVDIGNIDKLDKTNFIDIIHYVEIDVSCSPSFKKSLKAVGINEFVIRDAHGFRDNTDQQEADLKKMRELNSETSAEAQSELTKLTQKIERNYGLVGVDAVILFASKGELLGAGTGAAYSIILEDVLKLKPVFILSKSDLMECRLEECKDGETYETIMQEKRMQDTAHINEIANIITRINKKLNYKHESNQIELQKFSVKFVQYLLLSMVNNWDDPKQAEAYIESSRGCMDIILENISVYLAALKDVKDSKRLKDLLNVGMNDVLAAKAPYKAGKFIDVLLNPKQGWSSMVGVRGGLTTWVNGERVGERVISMMVYMYSKIKWIIEDIRRSEDKEVGDELLCAVATDALNSGQFQDWRQTIYSAVQERIIHDAFDLARERCVCLEDEIQKRDFAIKIMYQHVIDIFIKVLEDKSKDYIQQN